MNERVSVAILAAGLGTRMKSKQAKVLHRAGGLSLVEHVVRAARSVAGAEDIVAVVGHQAQKVQDTLAPYGVRFAEQREQKGTGHALEMCRQALEPAGGFVVVLYGDCPLLKAETVLDLVSRTRESGVAATLITTILDNPHGYGRIVRDPAGNVTAIVEEKAASQDQKLIREINSGIYCFRADLLWSHLGRIQPNSASGEIYLTDMVEILRAEGHPVAPMLLDDSSELLGINTRVELAEVDRLFRQRKTLQLMLDGVTIEQPDTVAIDQDVTIGRDTVVEPFTRILGRTAIGEDCRIGSGSVIRDSVLEDGVLIDSYTLIGTSRVGRDAHVGPFSRLRLDNDVEPGAHIGNFVELKKTRLGAGSKAMHLAYLGDSEIGAGANIGAGTITCNYDGTAKHKTRIGKGAFVGSNSTLVAPIEVGEGSYVAAGSVITDAVPEDNLALGRARQTLKPGWPSRRKAAAKPKEPVTAR
ncbi:MAG: bifunctional UDP-N-acetylglucosamine diphosphorylase/glucosamine-1-phosphate N-acetyltransferase GlmU [Bryobacteraceae bacterium]